MHSFESSLITLKEVENRAREEIKAAELEKEAIIADARRKAKALLDEARKLAEEQKQNFLESERKKVDEEVAHILSKAKEEAGDIRKLSASDEFIRELAHRIITSEI
ncbi:hypothetical protein [Methermicoccus shengliensis]|uniref:Uncharacterized protein n=1 Tax=Methermicoccus shengliensis TaxID=660064 RepID=A0A832VX39_9EURY|nr:hypothetical protein [Methermicoccus shengliensis]KUK05083.1 MAG: ATP synthase archaeal, H subunit [Euryarchaeota archaeon 55_53]KUK30376.1 MAG: ATP synthase archaeal, H subunit [Methanosarcinales archeaon 56_1174]MDI3487533.1 Vacuolar (H+)-ATPase subunit [Methanosarcinales archaeon]MDN5294682.1 Vacuolar (H+)-ATPase subunit [Methanosarcinales archaeon]HIH69393.1 hypothetical protein [Methermicoccus shengliensis]